MSAWWSARTPRERLIISAGAMIAALLGVGQFVISPIFRWRDGVETQAAAAEDGYRLVARSAAIATPAKAASAEPVRNVLNAAAGALGVELTFVNALPDGSVDLQAGPVAPERLFDLISRLDRDHGVKVRSADISRASENGDLVRVQANVAR